MNSSKTYPPLKGLKNISEGGKGTGRALAWVIRYLQNFSNWAVMQITHPRGCCPIQKIIMAVEKERGRGEWVVGNGQNKKGPEFALPSHPLHPLFQAEESTFRKHVGQDAIKGDGDDDEEDKEREREPSRWCHFLGRHRTGQNHQQKAPASHRLAGVPCF